MEARLNEGFKRRRYAPKVSANARKNCENQPVLATVQPDRNIFETPSGGTNYLQLDSPCSLFANRCARATTNIAPAHKRGKFRAEM